jgi:hypothetical protein
MEHQFDPRGPRVTLAIRIGVAVGFGVALCGAVGLYEFGRSPAATASLTRAGRTIEIRYSAPSVRGRQIFGAGGLLSKDPTYPAWRAGANAATTMNTTGDIQMSGLSVPAGTYTLYIWVEDPNAWELIVSRQTGQWGLRYHPNRDLGRVKMTMSTPSSPVETLQYSLIDKSGGKGELRLEWEHHVATVSLAVQ